MAEANKANEARYQQALAEMRTAQGKIAGQFDVARQDVGIGATRSLASQQQSLISAGLGSTTIQSAIARGTEEDRTRAMAGIAGQQGAAEAGMHERIAGLMERKQEFGPDLSMFANLMQGAAQRQQPRTVRRVLGPMASLGRTVFGKKMSGW